MGPLGTIRTNVRWAGPPPAENVLTTARVGPPLEPQPPPSDPVTAHSPAVTWPDCLPATEARTGWPTTETGNSTTVCLLLWLTTRTPGEPKARLPLARTNAT